MSFSGSGRLLGIMATRPATSSTTATSPSQHPLAIALEQGNLKRLDDEHIITEGLRTGIDEGNEAKDPMLLLRTQEIDRLEKLRDALTTERDGLQADLMKANSDRDRFRTQLARATRQNHMHTARIEALQSEVQNLRTYIEQRSSPEFFQRYMHPQIPTQPEDGHPLEQTSSRTDSDAGAARGESQEKTNLLQMVERQREEIAKWKGEAMGRGNEAVSACWQVSVDEAVRREREKDATVVAMLRAEIARLRM